jgi:serine phosphatase RsbU (regulator of sigma subunit)
MNTKSWIFLTTFLVLLSSGYAQKGNKSNVVKGQIDISDFELANEPIKLNGEWEFYWNQLLTNAQIQKTNVNYWNSEMPWNSYVHNSAEVGSMGCATYRAHLKNLPHNNVDILIKSVLSSCKVYINDSLIAEVGKVSNTKETYVPHYEEKVISVPNSLREFDLIVQIANYHHRNGGFETAFILGLEDDITSLKNTSLMYNSFTVSAFLFAGLFFLTIYLVRKKDISMLFFSLYCLLNAPRSFFSGDYIITSIFPNIKWNFVIHVEYISLILPIIFILLFINERFKEYSYEKTIRIIVLFLLLELLVLFIFPASIFTQLVISHMAITLTTIVIITVVVFKALFSRAKGSSFAFISIICLIASGIISMKGYVGLDSSLNFIFLILQLTFILMMSLILGSDFSSQFSKVEFLQKITENQKHIIEEKHKEITDSIKYAKHIQEAILPSNISLSEKLKNGFVLFKPKDVVSGDFYWMETYTHSTSQTENDHWIYFAAADCTGHGVPGAMLSVVCASALSKTLLEEDITDTGKILNRTRELVVGRFAKSNENVKDGMDISLCALHGKTLQWSGANNPLWILRKNATQIEETKPDKQPIGKVDNPRPFTSHTFNLEQGDTIYIFTDGYQDQFGGERGKKFKATQLKELLLQIQHKTMDVQKEILLTTFEKWRGGLDQIDDVCVIGVRV